MFHPDLRCLFAKGGCEGRRREVVADSPKYEQVNWLSIYQEISGRWKIGCLGR